MKIEPIKNEFDLRQQIGELKVLDMPYSDSEDFSPTNLIFLKICIEDENLKYRHLSMIINVVDYLKTLSEKKDFDTINRNEEYFKKIYCIAKNLKCKASEYYLKNENYSLLEEQILELIEIIFSLTFVIGEYFNLSFENENHKNDNEIIDSTPLIDMSNTKGTEKIIYLQELGIIEHLTNKFPQLTTNGLANLLSAITGEQTTTLQPYLNPMINKANDQRKNPYNSKKTVAKVKNKLIELNLNETKNT